MSTTPFFPFFNWYGDKKNVQIYNFRFDFSSSIVRKAIAPPVKPISPFPRASFWENIRGRQVAGGRRRGSCWKNKVGRRLIQYSAEYFIWNEVSLSTFRISCKELRWVEMINKLFFYIYTLKREKAPNLKRRSHKILLQLCLPPFRRLVGRNHFFPPLYREGVRRTMCTFSVHSFCLL